MPYDPGPRRKVKVAAMVAALDAARQAHTPPTSWTRTGIVLEAYTAEDWRQLAVAAGHPAKRQPSEDTRTQVAAMVEAAASAEWAAERAGAH